jgi:hypothetical protein
MRYLCIINHYDMNEGLFKACCAMMQDYPENAPRVRPHRYGYWGVGDCSITWEAYVSEQLAALHLTMSSTRDNRLKCGIEGVDEEINGSYWLEWSDAYRLFNFWNKLTMKYDYRMEVVYGFWMPVFFDMCDYGRKVVWTFEMGGFKLEIENA